MKYSETMVKICLLGSLWIDPATLVTDMDRPVLFRVLLDCRGEKCPQTVELIEKTDGGKIKARWEISAISQVGLYERRIQFKERHPKTLHFETVSEPPLKGTLLVEPRAPILTLLWGAFAKLWRH